MKKIYTNKTALVALLGSFLCVHAHVINAAEDSKEDMPTEGDTPRFLCSIPQCKFETKNFSRFKTHVRAEFNYLQGCADSAEKGVADEAKKKLSELVNSQEEIRILDESEQRRMLVEGTSSQDQKTLKKQRSLSKHLSTEESKDAQPASGTSDAKKKRAAAARFKCVMQ